MDQPSDIQEPPELALPVSGLEDSGAEGLFQFQKPIELTDPSALIALGTAIPVLCLAAFGYSLIRRINLVTELTQKDNPASAISFAGYIAAVGMILSGISSVPSLPGTGFFGEIVDTLLWGVGAVVVLLLSLLVNDRIVFPRMHNRAEIVEKRNVGLAVAEAGTFIAAAFVMQSSLGEQFSPASLPAPVLTILYFIFGQTMFLIYSRVYPLVANLKLREDLAHENSAVGIAFAGSLVAFAVLMANAMTFYNSLTTILVLSVIYMAGLLLIRFLVRICFRRIVSHELEDDKNWGIGMLEATVSLAIAMILTATL